MSAINVNITELEAVAHTFWVKANYFVSDSVRHGTDSAQRWAAHNRAHPGKMHRPIRRKRRVMHVASGPLIAHYVEQMAFLGMVRWFK